MSRSPDRGSSLPPWPSTDDPFDPWPNGRFQRRRRRSRGRRSARRRGDPWRGSWRVRVPGSRPWSVHVDTPASGAIPTRIFRRLDDRHRRSVTAIADSRVGTSRRHPATRELGWGHPGTGTGRSASPPGTTPGRHPGMGTGWRNRTRDGWPLALPSALLADCPGRAGTTTRSALPRYCRTQEGRGCRYSRHPQGPLWGRRPSAHPRSADVMVGRTTEPTYGRRAFDASPPRSGPLSGRSVIPTEGCRRCGCTR